MIMSFELLTRSFTTRWRKSVKHDARRKERGLRKTRRPAGDRKNREVDSLYGDDRVHVRDISLDEPYELSRHLGVQPAGPFATLFCRSIRLVDGDIRNEKKREGEKERKR